MRIEEIISQQVFADLDSRLATFEQQLVLISVEHQQLADLVRSEVTALSQSHVVLSERVEAVHAKLDEILAAIGNVPPVTPEDPWQPVSAQVNAFTNPDWDRGVYRTKAGVSIKANEAFAVGAHVKLADGQVRLVNMVTLSGENQSVFFEGPLLDPALVGAPNVITTTLDPIYISEPVVQPEPDGYVGPLVGANFAGLGNNPWFNPTTQPAQLGTHYRTSKLTAQNPDFFELYGAHLIDDEEFLVRMPYALERLFVIQDGQPVLQEGYANEMIAFMDAAYAQGGRTIMDMHNYCRVWQPEQFNADGTLKYPGLTHKVQTVNNKTVRAQWFPINHPGCWWNYDTLATAYRLIAQRFGSHPGLLAYGLMNEPHARSGEDMNVDQVWMQNVQKLINEIRSVDDHWITVAGCAYSNAKTWRLVSDPLREVTGDRIMFEAHLYPDENGGGGGQWKAGISHSVDPVARVNDWRDFLAWCAEVGRPAYAGEFGCPADIPGGTEFLHQLHELFDEHDVLRTQWLSGPGKSDTYANGMDTAAGELKPNAAATINRIGLMKD